ncbi:MAG: hypothetical protein R3C10_01590 [Pirellulales bacterium]
MTFDGIYGVGASPAAHGGIVVIWNGMHELPHLCALDVETGKVLWRNKLAASQRISGNSRTPLIRNLAGHDTVIVWAVEGLLGFDLHTGARSGTKTSAAGKATWWHRPCMTNSTSTARPLIAPSPWRCRLGVG